MGVSLIATGRPVELVDEIPEFQAAGLSDFAEFGSDFFVPELRPCPRHDLWGKGRRARLPYRLGQDLGQISSEARAAYSLRITSNGHVSGVRFLLRSVEEACVRQVLEGSEKAGV